MTHRHGGFTLIEIMITIVIVAILAAVALPAYNEQLRKSRRAEAKVALLKTMQLQERFYTTSLGSTYTTDLGLLYGSAGAAVNSNGENPTLATAPHWYVITADTTDCGGAAPILQSCVRLVATPREGYTDDNCGILTLNSRGVQTESGLRDVAYCWRG